MWNTVNKTVKFKCVSSSGKTAFAACFKVKLWADFMHNLASLGGRDMARCRGSKRGKMKRRERRPAQGRRKTKQNETGRAGSGSSGGAWRNGGSGRRRRCRRGAPVARAAAAAFDARLRDPEMPTFDRVELRRRATARFEALGEWGSFVMRKRTSRSRFQICKILLRLIIIIIIMYAHVRNQFTA